MCVCVYHFHKYKTQHQFYTYAMCSLSFGFLLLLLFLRYFLLLLSFVWLFVFCFILRFMFFFLWLHLYVRLKLKNKSSQENERKYNTFRIASGCLNIQKARIIFSFVIRFCSLWGETIKWATTFSLCMNWYRTIHKINTHLNKTTTTTMATEYKGPKRKQTQNKSHFIIYNEISNESFTVWSLWATIALCCS